MVRLSAMGDVAMLVPAVQALREKHPQARITVVSKAFHKPIFQGIDDIDFMTAEVKGRHKGVLGMQRLAKDLKAKGVTHLADCHNVLRSKILRAFLRIGPVKVAVIDKGRAEKEAMCRPGASLDKALKSSHQRYADCLDSLGFAVNLDHFTPLTREPLPSKIVESLEGWSGKLLGIAPFAAFDSKAYDEDLMRLVLEGLSERKDLKILLFGGPNEVEQLQNMSDGLVHVVVVAGKLKFDQELALISNLDGMLAMDSGNGHLAANFGIPVMTIWGVTHPYLGFAPFGQKSENWLLPDLEKFPAIPTSVYGKSYPKGYESAINSILPNQVIDLINKII